MNSPHHSRSAGDLVFLQALLGKLAARLVSEDEPNWDAGGVAALGLRDVLLEENLSDDELTLARGWGDRATRRLLDRLAERRVERALAFAIEMEAGERSVRLPADRPRVTLVRSAIEALGGSDILDIAGLDPGEPIEALVDAIVLAKQEKGQEQDSSSSDIAAFRIEAGGQQWDLLEDKKIDHERLEESIRQLEQRLLTALESTHTIGSTDEFEEHDLSGMLLGGKYRVKRLRGKGGFGNVYEAVDEGLGARVAIKVLNRRAEGSPRAVEHFLREAKLLTTLDHENIVRWITFDRTDDGLHYFVMEFLGGEELEEILLREGRIAPKRAAGILLRVLAGLRAAHGLEGGSLLHLDLKPENVFLLPATGPGDAERVKVIDFGIGQHVGASARAVEDPPDGEASSIFSEDPARSLSATVSREVLQYDRDNDVTRVRGGTLLYASPEQCAHLAGHAEIVSLDGRSDLYSLGITAFRMLTGELPFEKCDTATTAIQNHLEVPPHKVRDLVGKVPRRLAGFVDRCLEKNRDERFRDAAEAYDELDRIVNPPATWPKIAAACLILAAALVWGFWPESRLEPFDISLAQGRVFLGVEQRSRVLPVTNLHPGSAPGSIAFVTNPQTDEPALAGWEGAIVAQSNRFSISLTAPSDLHGSFEARIYVRVESSEGTQYSQPIDVSFLGAGALRVDEVLIPGLAERALDPHGATLEIRIDGQRRDIETVTVRWAQVSRVATFDESRIGANRLFYTLPLESFGVLDETAKELATFEVELLDRAGRISRHAPLEVALDARVLLLSASIEGCLRERLDEYVVYPEDLPILEIDSNRDILTEITAFDHEGRELELTSENIAQGKTRLRFPTADKPYGGHILIRAQDDRSVLHVDRSRGRAEKRLQFSYQTMRPSLVVAPVGLIRSNNRAAEGDRPLYFTNLEHVELALERNDVRISVDVLCESAAAAPVRSSVPLHQNSADTVRFPLPVDGAYHIKFDAYRYSGANTARAERPEESYELDIVRDTSSPRVLLSGPSDTVIRELSQLHLQLAVEGQELEHASPLTIRSQLFAQNSSAALVSSVIPANVIRATGSSLLTPQQLGIGELRDGSFELRVDGSDEAGNRVQAGVATYRFELARVGPELTLETPVTGRWSALAGNHFRITVRAEDENGVEAVHCTARIQGGAEQGPLKLCRPTAGADRKQASWTGEIELPASWSGQRVTLTCRAVDVHGNESAPLTRDVDVDSFQVTRPDLVGLVLADAVDLPVTRMRLVEGDARYTFGGRSRRLERKAFQKFGLTYDFRSQVDERSVDDYYLDETEVTVAQYRAFVEAASGYRSPSSWDAAPPGEARRLDLADLLQSEADELPVTNIDWLEAAAYARWLGKRLPTLLEWEYAVRGGRAYRPYSSALQGTPIDATTFNVNTDFSDDRAAWPVTTGTDLTPAGLGSGLRNLCSNVSEWTATPRGSGYRYAAGASFTRLGTYDFTVATPKPLQQRSLRIGFRCALNVEDLDAASEGKQESRLRVLLNEPQNEPRNAHADGMENHDER